MCGISVEKQVSNSFGWGEVVCVGVGTSKVVGWKGTNSWIVEGLDKKFDEEQSYKGGDIGIVQVGR